MVFLLDTIAYYGKDPVNRRSFKAGSCYYRYPGDPNKRCAIGRFMTDEEAELAEPQQGVEDTQYTHGMCARLSHFGPVFLRTIQKLHDWNCYWALGGLSKKGIREVTRIVKNFAPDYLHLFKNTQKD